MVSLQGGLSLGWPLTVVSHQVGLSSGWSLTVVSHECGLSSRWFSYQGSQGGFLLWSLMRVVSHQGGSLIRVVSHQGGLS